MKTYGVWEPYAVKAQTIKTSIEAACLILRVDDVVSGVSQKANLNTAPKEGGAEAIEGAEQ
jgi:T-complex protein 1 subunit gamma